LQLIIDTSAILVGIYLTGGAHSEMVFMLLAPLASASLLSKRRWIAMIFLTGWLGYFIISYGEYAQLFGPYGNFTPYKGIDNFFRLMAFSLIGTIVSFQISFFVTRIKMRDREIATLKDELFFRTVHDLRAPLTALRWITDKFGKPEFLAKNPEVSQDLSNIRDLHGRMLALIKDALAVGKGEKIDLQLAEQKIELNKFLNNLVEQFQPAGQGQNIQVIFLPAPRPVTIKADAEALKEIFSNLLDNAIKYNRSGGKVEVEVFQEVNLAKIVVRDEGLGISKEGLKNLFNPYFRDNNVKDLPGTGLGLYLVKKLATKMNGQIAVASTLNQGTAFTLLFPIKN
jgi:signal transduction histidine kinase